jgi:hypothetical protein
MKTRQRKKSYRGVFIILTAAFVSCTQAYGGDLLNSKTRSMSAAQNQKAQKARARRINPAAVSPSSFTPETTLNDAINILRNTTIPPLNIVVLWRNLETVNIDRETPIGYKGITGVPLRTHLKLLLMSLSGGSTEKLGYVVKDGVIIISTESTLPNRFRTQIYDVTDLVGTPAGAGMMPMMGMPFGLGAMPFGGMMSLGLGGMLGGMMPFGGMGYTGQGQMPYGNTNYR